MAIMVTDVEELENPSAPPPAQELPEEETVPLVAALRGRGRPPGSKDKQPRKRPARAACADVPDEEEEPPPSPRTKRHQEWTAYRQQRANAHQANINRYAALFDRMLA